MIGAGSNIKGENSAKVRTFLGEISYPLYITHYPSMYMQMNWAWSNVDAPMYAHVIVAISTVVLSIGLAYACLKLYDIPVRKWLTEKWLKK
jgi:peptidoglycan/LPS O-acetylase OafA/YrhL